MQTLCLRAYAPVLWPFLPPGTQKNIKLVFVQRIVTLLGALTLVRQIGQFALILYPCLNAPFLA